MLIFEEWMEYLDYYPGEDESEYDGKHDGGIKGIKDNAPDEVKKAFDKFMKEQQELKSRNIKI